MRQEQAYNAQWEAAKGLAELYDSYGVDIFVMKGFSLSRLYPRPEHRPCTDMDCYLKDKYDGDENLLMQATVEDIRKFGMIPEFIGRLPIMFSLEALTEDMLVKILKEPKNAIIKQYQKLLEMDEVRLEFDDDALYAIAKMAKEKKVGARALRAIIEDFMLDIMYEIPKDDNIGTVTITKDYVEKKGGPLIQMRGTPELADSQHV